MDNPDLDLPGKFQMTYMMEISLLMIAVVFPFSAVNPPQSFHGPMPTAGQHYQSGHSPFSGNRDGGIEEIRSLQDSGSSRFEEHPTS